MHHWAGIVLSSAFLTENQMQKKFTKKIHSQLSA